MTSSNFDQWQMPPCVVGAPNRAPWERSGPVTLPASASRPPAPFADEEEEDEEEDEEDEEEELQPSPGELWSDINHQIALDHGSDDYYYEHGH